MRIEDFRKIILIDDKDKKYIPEPNTDKDQYRNTRMDLYKQTFKQLLKEHKEDKNTKIIFYLGDEKFNLEYEDLEISGFNNDKKVKDNNPIKLTTVSIENHKTVAESLISKIEVDAAADVTLILLDYRIISQGDQTGQDSFSHCLLEHQWSNKFYFIVYSDFNQFKLLRKFDNPQITISPILWDRGGRDGAAGNVGSALSELYSNELLPVQIIDNNLSAEDLLKRLRELLESENDDCQQYFRAIKRIFAGQQVRRDKLLRHIYENKYAEALKELEYINKEYL